MPHAHLQMYMYCMPHVYFLNNKNVSIHDTYKYIAWKWIEFFPKLQDNKKTYLLWIRWIYAVPMVMVVTMLSIGYSTSFNHDAPFIITIFNTTWNFHIPNSPHIEFTSITLQQVNQCQNSMIYISYKFIKTTQMKTTLLVPWKHVMRARTYIYICI